jgi:hypothetical protein
MKHFPSILTGIAALGVLLAVTPDRASAKCGLTPTVRGTAMVLDGHKIGEVDMTEDLFDTTPLAGRFDWDPFIEGKTVIFFNFGCWTERDPETGVMTVQESYYVLTTDYLGLALARMEGLQSAYRTAQRRYAGNVSELGSHIPMEGVQASLRATESGWSAVLHHVFNSQVTCHLAVGDPELLLPGQTLGQVHCIDNMPRRTDA